MVSDRGLTTGGIVESVNTGRLPALNRSLGQMVDQDRRRGVNVQGFGCLLSGDVNQEIASFLSELSQPLSLIPQNQDGVISLGKLFKIKRVLNKRASNDCESIFPQFLKRF